eukprot:c2538_g1_i1 orf=54-278(+)
MLLHQSPTHYFSLLMPFSTFIGKTPWLSAIIALFFCSLVYHLPSQQPCQKFELNLVWILSFHVKKVYLCPFCLA